MARVEISFFSTGNRSREGGTMPVPHRSGLRTEVLESGQASVQTAGTSAEAASAGFVRILSAADVWIAAGAAPVAAVPTVGATAGGLRVSAGIAFDLAVSAGDRIAVVDAAAL